MSFTLRLLYLLGKTLQYPQDKKLTYGKNAGFRRLKKFSWEHLHKTNIKDAK
jgi:hypothetical protein